MPTFAESTRRVWHQLRPGWRFPEHAQLWISTVERFAFPRIGAVPISDVTNTDLIGILAPIWQEKAPTARELRQRIRATDGTGRGDEPHAVQSVRLDRSGPGGAWEGRTAHADVTAPRVHGCAPNAARLRRSARRKLVLRILRGDGDALRRGAGSGLE